MPMTNPDPTPGLLRRRVIAVAGIAVFAVACSSSKATHTKKAQQARQAAQMEAMQEAARPKPAVAAYIQETTFRFGQVWQQFLSQYGNQLPIGSRVVVVFDVTREGQLAGLRFEQPTSDADILERGIATALAATQFDPFSDEMQRELGQTASVQIRLPVAVR
jgi:hypothetical protein